MLVAAFDQLQHAAGACFPNSAAPVVASKKAMVKSQLGKKPAIPPVLHRVLDGAARIGLDAARLSFQELGAALQKFGLLRAQRRRRHKGLELVGKPARRSLRRFTMDMVVGLAWRNSAVEDTGLPAHLLDELWKLTLRHADEQAHVGQSSFKSRWFCTLMMFRGHTPASIARRMGCSAVSVSRWFWATAKVIVPVLQAFMTVRASPEAAAAANQVAGGLFHGMAGIVDGFTVEVAGQASDGKDESAWVFDVHHGIPGLNYMLVVDIFGRVLDLYCIGFGSGSSELASHTRYVRQQRRTQNLKEGEFYLSDSLYATAVGAYGVPGLKSTQRLAAEVAQQVRQTQGMPETWLQSELVARHNAGAALAITQDFMEHVVSSTRIVVENVIAHIKSFNPRLGGRHKRDLLLLKDRALLDTMVRGTVGLIAFKSSHKGEAARSSWFGAVQSWKHTGPISMALRAQGMMGAHRDYAKLAYMPAAFASRRDHRHVEKLLHAAHSALGDTDELAPVTALKAMNLVMKSASAAYVTKLSLNGIAELRPGAVNPRRGLRAGTKRSMRRLPGLIVRYRHEFEDEDTCKMVRPLMLCEPIESEELIAQLAEEVSLMDCSDMLEGTPLYQAVDKMHWILWWYGHDGHMMMMDNIEGDGVNRPKPQAVQVSDAKHWREVSAKIDLLPPTLLKGLLDTPIMDHSVQVSTRWAEKVQLPMHSMLAAFLTEAAATADESAADSDSDSVASAGSDMAQAD